MDDLISIIVPVYNVEKYLEKCINSLISQTYSNIEIILVDDGSTDSSSQIIDDYAKKDFRIKVIHKKNGGQSEARNVGINISHGKYITFVDSDDYISIDYIEYLYCLLKKYNGDISICSVKVVNENNNKSRKEETRVEIYNKQQAFENLLYSQGIEVAVYAKMYEKSYFDNIEFPVGQKYEDIAIIYKLMDKANKIIYGNKECYFYLTRKGSTSKSGFNENELWYIKNVNKMLDFFDGNYKDLANATNRYRVYSNFRILRILLFSKNKDNEIMRKTIKNIKLNCNDILKDSKAPKRDKIAIITLKMGLPIFKLSWYIYSKATRRVL